MKYVALNLILCSMYAAGIYEITQGQYFVFIAVMIPGVFCIGASVGFLEHSRKFIR